MRRVRQGVPRPIPGRIHRGSQGPVVRRALLGMEARNCGRELVLCRLLGGQVGHRLSGTHTRGARSPQGITTGSGARQSISPTLRQTVHLRQLRLLLHRSRQGLAPRQLRLGQGQSLAGPPRLRKGCFPKLHERETETLWRNGTWNAKFLCRTCLVQEWEKKPWEIERWLSLHNDGAWKAASI